MVLHIKKIILYSTGCPKCNVLKKKLAEFNIDYEENNSIDEMIGLGIKEIPVLKIEDKLLDFSEAIKWLSIYG